MRIASRNGAGESAFSRLVVCLWLSFNLACVPLGLAAEDVASYDSVEVAASSAPLSSFAWGMVTPYEYRLAGGHYLNGAYHGAMQDGFSWAKPLSAALAVISLALSCFLFTGAGRKSQVTIFILLGFVILIAFLFMFFLSSITSEETKGSLEKASQTTQDANTIKYYAYTCLEYAATDALIKLGRQGGIIHEYQNGSLFNWSIPYFSYSDEQGIEHNVTYQIYSDLSGVYEPKDSKIRDDEYYPCRKGYTSSFFDPVQGDLCHVNYEHTLSNFGRLAGIFKFGKTGFFSESNRKVLPDLCKENIVTNKLTCTCPENHKCEYSIEAQLEEYVRNRTLECLNFSTFRGYDIMTGNASVDATINRNDIDIVLDLPVIVEWKGGQPVTRIARFHSLHKVRLKMLHPLLFGDGTDNLFFPNGTSIENIRGIIDNERDISFNLIDDGQALLNSVGDMYIKRTRPNPEVSIVIINDTGSDLSTHPYIFMFAIENRRPALDYYNPDNVTWNGVDYHVYAIEGATINISPEAYDPDEDALVYAYSGWKAGWNDVYNPRARQLSELISTFPYNGNLWNQSRPYSEGCLHEFYGNTTMRCGQYTTKAEDIGWHNLTIKVFDPAGEWDSQLVRVLVDDKPRIGAVMDNFYADVNNSYASPEDNYLINASSSFDFIGTGPLEYYWEDRPFPETINHPQHTSYSSANSVHRFPYEYWDNITRIHQEPHHFWYIGTHYITIYARRDAAESSKTYQVEVMECLPHRNNAPPYPWNLGLSLENEIEYPVIDDPFQANHTCCTDSFEIMDNGECFRLADYGSLEILSDEPSLLDSSHRMVGSSPKEPSVAGDFSGENSFDIWKRDFAVQCDGLSGNICISRDDEKTEHTISWFSECPPAGSGLHEKCSYAIYGDQPKCINAPADTSIDFTQKKIIRNLPCDSTWVCNNQPDQHVLMSPGYECDHNDPLHGDSCYICQSTCDGKGGCNRSINCIKCYGKCTYGQGSASCS